MQTAKITATVRSPKKKRKPTLMGQAQVAQKEYFFVTMIVPSMVEMLQVRELFELAVD